jgi:hypothetical protein
VSERCFLLFCSGWCGAVQCGVVRCGWYGVGERLLTQHSIHRDALGLGRGLAYDNSHVERGCG